MEFFSLSSTTTSISFFIFSICFSIVSFSVLIFSILSFCYYKYIDLETTFAVYSIRHHYFLIYERFISEGHFTVKKHFLLSNAGKFTYFRRCLGMIMDISNAKYIFLDEACDALGRIPFRNSTKIIQVWHACGAFKKFGFSTAEICVFIFNTFFISYPNCSSVFASG